MLTLFQSLLVLHIYIIKALPLLNPTDHFQKGLHVKQFLLKKKRKKKERFFAYMTRKY